MGLAGLGGWEILLILMVLLMLAAVVIGVIGLVFFLNRKKDGKAASAPPVIAPAAPGAGK